MPAILFNPNRVFSNPYAYLSRKIQNTLRSALFLSVYVFNMKLTACWWRRLEWHFMHRLVTHPYMSLTGGFMSGLSIFVEKTARRVELALYVLPRAMEVGFRLMSKNKWPFIHEVLRSQYTSMMAFQFAIATWMILMNTQNGRDSLNSLNLSVLKVVFGTHH